MSVAPPGGNGTMSFTGFCGQACAERARRGEQRRGERRMRESSCLSSCRTILQRQGEREPDGERERRRQRGERLLPVAPRQELEREHAQPAGEMRGEQRPRCTHSPSFTSGCSVQRRNSSSAPRPAAPCRAPRSAAAGRARARCPDTRCTRNAQYGGGACFMRTPPTHRAHAGPARGARANSSSATSRERAAPAEPLAEHRCAGRSARAPRPRARTRE